MTVLIGGPPGGGKTTLGQAIAVEVGGHSLTIDDIRTALLGTTTPQTHPEIHVVGQPDPWDYFTNTSPKEMVKHAIDQHTTIWPGVVRVIRRRSHEETALVVDGWHLMPDLVAAAELQDLVAVWLDVSHEVLEERERAVWNFYAKSEDPKRMFTNFLGRSILWNDMMRAQARATGYRVIHQDGTKAPHDLVNEVLG